MKDTEVFLIMTNRKDKKIPGIEKTINMKMHWTKSEAQEDLDQLTKDLGPYYGIYKAVVKVVTKVG